MPISIDWWISELRNHGADAVDQYERKLRSFGSNEQKVFELIAEARTALYFLKNGLTVTMQDRPDLRLDFQGEIIYAEVKHQNEKEADRRDAQAMRRNLFELIPVGDVFQDEQQHGYQGMCATAIKKVTQYIEASPNILVFVNRSVSIDLHLRSAVNEFDAAVRKEGAKSPLRNLGGMMMFGASHGPRNGWSNVEFCHTSHAINPINPYLANLINQRQLA